jgi:hypothetical protein
MLITRYVDPSHPDAQYVKINGSEFPVPKPDAHRQILDLAALAALDASQTRVRIISLATDAYASTYNLEETHKEDGR